MVAGGNLVLMGSLKADSRQSLPPSPTWDRSLEGEGTSALFCTTDPRIPKQSTGVHREGTSGSQNAKKQTLSWRPMTGISRSGVMVTGLPSAGRGAFISHESQSLQTSSPFYRRGNGGPGRSGHALRSHRLHPEPWDPRPRPSWLNRAVS